MSSDRPPEFFFDRSLGRRSAGLLQAAGWTIHLIADHYARDAMDVPDADWIREGCQRGWNLLTKDQRIRYRADELGSLDGHLFCLASGNLSMEAMAMRFDLARPAIERAASSESKGFWLVYDEGRIRRTWP